MGVVVPGVRSFSTPAQLHGNGRWEQSRCTSGGVQRRTRTAPSSFLAMASISRTDVSVPSQAQCEALGVREWPQQSKKGSWNENVAPENSLVRYVLEGTGSLAITSSTESGDDAQATQSVSVKPGTLVQIEAGSPAIQLEWKCDVNCPEIILLTPGFEEGNVFLGVIAGILVLFGALLSGALG